jgi:hypothetical protein
MPELRDPRQMAGLATSVAPLASLALLAAVALQPASAIDQDARTSSAVDSYDGFDAQAA